MEVLAKSRYTGISARKVRLVMNEVRGMQAREAVHMLQLMPQSAAAILATTINSALANAEENFDLDKDVMYVKSAYADQAPHRKWRRFGGRGRFKPWKRNSSNITIILDERDSSLDS